MKDGEVFTILVTDARFVTYVLTADGSTFMITATFTGETMLPEGTELVAVEIEPGTDEYIQYLGRTWAEVNKAYLEQEERLRGPGLDEMEDIRPVNIDAARFFDITFVYEGEALEPKAPVQVDI